MARVYEFVMGSEGDPSVGIQGFRENVTVIFHGPDDDSEPEDTIESICKLLGELADGWCVSRADWDKGCVKDAVADALGYEDWKRDHPGEATGKEVKMSTHDEHAVRCKVLEGKVLLLEGEVERITKQRDEANEYKAKFKFDLDVMTSRAELLFGQVKMLKAKENERLKATKDAG